MQPSGKYRVVLFDFDGTLADSESAHHRVWNEILGEMGAHIDDEEYKRESSGTPVTQEVERLIRTRGLDISPQALVDRKVERTVASFTENPIALMDHALEILEWCRARGLATALVTGSGREEIAPTIEHYDLAGFFDHVVTRNDVTHSKPHPDCYLKALGLCGIEADQAVAIEDTRHGVDAACAAGIDVIVIPNAYSCGQDTSRATARLESLAQARDWIDARRAPR
ncbi:HAD family hydrolase [Kushneria sp. TE3]|uniref:HAD family hydrolase n=1 Tax=Kushneria sp. TE3 TaxID=3449832 RepID=UPI003F6893E3